MEEIDMNFIICFGKLLHQILDKAMAIYEIEDDQKNKYYGKDMTMFRLIIHIK